MTKRFVALARVSSREQEREGFSLDVQEDALARYAKREGGEIVRFYRIAETASKRDERRTFKELLAYAREHATELDGVLFYKVDRAARNIFDYVELERLEADHSLPVVYVAQPTENTPAGRMQRRILSNMAAFYTEQQSLDVREGMARRVQQGLFVGKAPYGYQNTRVDGRGLVEVHPEHGPKVRRIFDLYAYHNCTLDGLVAQLSREGITYTASRAAFARSQLHAILRDRSYIGELSYRGQWHAGTHEPLVDGPTWERVQALLGAKIYTTHEMTFAGGLITCGHCGSPITGERKTKQTRKGEVEYVYYRCTQYNRKGHPRVRVKEADLDAQVLALFDRLRIEDEKVRQWFHRVLREKARDTQRTAAEGREGIRREMEGLHRQLDRLLNLRLLEEIEAETFAGKSAELKQRIKALRLSLEVGERGHDEYADIAVKAFELSQRLREKWLTADYTAKRHLLEIVCLNFRLNDVSLVPTMRKPFDVLAEGPSFQSGRGDWI